MEISNDKEEVEKDANFEILGVNAIQQSAKLARLGEFKKAQINAKAWDKRMTNAAKQDSQVEQLKNYRDNVNEMYKVSYQEQRR